MPETRHGIAGLHPALADKTRQEIIELGKWWNVPSEEQAVLMDAETFIHPWSDTIAARLTDVSGYYTGLPTSPRPTAWDGTTGDAADWGNLLTVTRIGIAWLGLTHDQLGRGSATGKTIGAIMRSLGWTATQVRIPGSTLRTKAYVLSPMRVAEIENQRLERADMAAENNNGDIGDTRDIVRDDCEDIPF